MDMTSLLEEEFAVEIKSEQETRGKGEEYTDDDGSAPGRCWHAATGESIGPISCLEEQVWSQQENPELADQDIFGALAFNVESPSFQICFGDLSGQGVLAVSGEEHDLRPTCAATPNLPEDESQMLSVGEIVKLAGVKFVQMCFLDVDPTLDISCQRNLSDKESQDVQLVEHLLFCAEKVHYQQFDRASKLLCQLSLMCSNDGNPIQRLVYYFAEALHVRIDRGSGRITDNEHGLKRTSTPWADKKTTINYVAYHQGIPFMQIAQFTGVQAIINSVSKATRIHVIDLQISSGVQWTVLLQALALRHNRKIELLKITALATSMKNMVEGTGTGLKRLAESLNIPFEFSVVLVKDMLDLRREHFDLSPKETVVVYSQFFLQGMIPQPDRLESLMKVIRDIHPRRMVVIETEANHNSPDFVGRFIDYLFYVAAFFDCLEACVEKERRKSMESMFFVPAIKNIVAAEGEDRKYRSVKVDVWKAYLSRFKMAEVELGEMALYQANLVTEQFGCCGKSCTFENKGKSLIVGWKGTPVQSISLFKFK
ncbi:hypothetical protein MLD38_023597 [Melastoma candidum]|uniref:Uncharacterized protein n=1 Tax=Melastoma candidum TaxID=119954 RepID=A0ACB9NSD6_9MYRT|nr:hypothetical protein MLD38_023597 [Melastoma candidum]